jgi:hypothetical protein
MPTKSVSFTSSGTWTCPPTVSAVLLTMIGGGSGMVAMHEGGAGGAEAVIGLMIPVVPNQEYSVVVGSKGLGADAEGEAPVPPTASSFAGFTALGAGKRQTPFGEDAPFNFVGRNSGSGGGAGGALGGSGGGGFEASGVQEAPHFFGGSAGGYGVSGSDVGGHGGLYAVKGSTVGGNTNSGGPGGSSIWGRGGNGGDASGVDGVCYNKDAPATSYGAGAGGNGNSPDIGQPAQGGDGANGLVSLLWFEGT